MDNPENDAFFAINALPREVLGHILRWLEVAERLRGERVCRLWRSVGLELGWSEQTKLNEGTVFPGTTITRRDAFNYEHLADLIRRSASKLAELNLRSFGQRQGPIQRVFEQIQLLPRLNTLYIVDNVQLPIVQYLPGTLRELHSDTNFDDRSLAVLPAQCPNLEYINLYNSFPQQSVSGLNNFLGAYSSTLKKLTLAISFTPTEETTETLRIGSLTALEELDLTDMNASEYQYHWFSDGSLRGMVAGCRRLKRLALSRQFDSLSEDALLELSALPELRELRIFVLDGFTDVVLKAIARRGKLEKFTIRSRQITDESVVYLIENCKSLVELRVLVCENITEVSVHALAAENDRRRRPISGPIILMSDYD